MTIEYHELLGDTIGPEQLTIPKARDLAEILSGDGRPFVRLVECRVKGNIEVVVFDVEVERGQRTIHPIQRDERIAAIFDKADQTLPLVWALRKDFPQVPHLNIAPFDSPKSLCLYDEPYRDLKKRWTAVRFVDRIREWLALTAKGMLHEEDQPLEPLLTGHAGTIVLPASLQEPGKPELPTHLSIFATCTEKDRYFLVADLDPPKNDRAGVYAVASVHICPPQKHGVMQWSPQNVKQLGELLATAGMNLVAELRERFQAWEAQRRSNPKLLDAHLVLIILIPKVREAGAEPESRDAWAFVTDDSLRDVGVKLGIWGVTDGQLGWLLRPGEDASVGVGVELLNPSFRLTRERAARLSGHRVVSDIKAVAVGAGALGSQVLMNLARSGFGTWHIVDNDRLLPHNLVRHSLNGHALAFFKAASVAIDANSLMEGEPAFAAVEADLLDPKENATKLAEALGQASLILDMSASVTVARNLALRIDATARRVSLFMNPTGEDLVLLAEDEARKLRLDSLEMQYYRALAADPQLEGHYKPGARNRYGQSCRDITSSISQDQVALLAAIAGRAVRQAHATPTARITVWRSANGNVRRIDVPPAPTIIHQVGDWTLCTDAMLVHRLAELRESKLPNETGGVLLGSFDLEQKIVYIIDTIPSPPDSEEWPTLYIRGCQGLEPLVAKAAARTDGMLEYIGEWHSHPDGCSTAPSDDDLEGFVQLTALMGGDGLPAVILIVGEGGNASSYIGEMMRLEYLLPRPPE